MDRAITERNEYDVVVIGSGFGGSVAALRLSEKGYRVAVVEAGRRYEPDDFPRTNWNLRRYLWMPKIGLRGIQRMTLLPDALVLSGAGVGGGSLVYAGTLYEAPEEVWDDPQWSGLANWKQEMPSHYETARRMLGVTQTPVEGDADRVLRKVAEALDVADTYRPTPVGIYFGNGRAEPHDPYFEGEGPDRTPCTYCGGCLVGCRQGAKNSLDKNYLWLAERAGAVIHAETEVVDVIARAEDHFEVVTKRSGSWSRGRTKSFQAGRVVIAAGVLGTLKLLFRLRETGRLPDISPRLGDIVRTNSESIVGATGRSGGSELSKGVAIGSSIYPDAVTHIEAVRYPAGSNFMGTLTTLLVDGGGRVPRTIRLLGEIVRHPVRCIRSLSVRRWSERTIALLVMQTADNALRLYSRRGRLKSRQSSDKPNPTYIPVANEAARVAAKVIDGYPVSMLNEAVLDRPSTGHILGGAVMGASSDDGVIDHQHRLFGYQNIFVIDGSAVSANLGVNPALTITALAERAVALWPPKHSDPTEISLEKPTILASEQGGPKP